jgi:hypothetical protein
MLSWRGISELTIINAQDSFSKSAK